ncbi:transposase [Raoultella sp. BIGb0399]|nr:transposase [Raoultella sp. BIGb0399]
MSGKRYPKQFKIEAVKQVVNRVHSFSRVATRLGITTHSLYAWIKKYGPDSSSKKEQSDTQDEIRRLQKELKRVPEQLMDKDNSGESYWCKGNDVNSSLCSLSGVSDDHKFALIQDWPGTA